MTYKCDLVFGFQSKLEDEMMVKRQNTAANTEKVTIYQLLYLGHIWRNRVNLEQLEKYQLANVMKHVYKDVRNQ